MTPKSHPVQEGMTREYCNCGRALCGYKEKETGVCYICAVHKKLDLKAHTDQHHECDPLIDIPVVAHRCNTCGRLHVYEVIQSVGTPYKLRKIGIIEVPE